MHREIYATDYCTRIHSCNVSNTQFKYEICKHKNVDDEPTNLALF